jgi:hypothetical protein
MRRHRYVSWIAVGSLSLAVLAGTAACAPATGRVYIHSGPPARFPDVRSYAPGPGYVWVQGYQSWNGRGYYWVPGRWVRPPRARAQWVPGRWAHDRHGYYWIEGRWR